MQKITVAFVIVGILAFATSAKQRRTPHRIARETYGGWRQFGGASDNIHYSSLSQINRDNVRKLQAAWSYDTGDAFHGSEMECNPIVVDGVLFATTPRLRVIALDAATGKLKWSFNPNENGRPLGNMRNRGVTYWKRGGDRRIFFGCEHWLYSLDATTGVPAKTFGEGGRVDMREGLGRDPRQVMVRLSTPGVIYKDLLIVGSLVSEALPAAPGHIRAYDAITGKLRWTFHTIPQPGEFGYETWPKDAWQYIGGANNWCGLTVDQQRGLVFAPTGSAAFDFYGGNRHGDNLFANTLLCLDANTGKRIWHFQAVRHDLWDRDFPTAPALVTLNRNGRRIDALAQPTKSGHVFVFERASGRPVFPIEYRTVSTAWVPGERVNDTQPLPVLPPPFARQKLTEEMLTNRTPEAHAAAVERLRKLRSGGQFEPPSLEGTVIFPGFDGGAEWGGSAFDPETGLLYVNSNEMAWVLRLVRRQVAKQDASASMVYSTNCASCHKTDMSGTPPEFPSLTGLASKYNEGDVQRIIGRGLGRMPGFSRLGDEAVKALAKFLLTGADSSISGERLARSPIDLEYSIDGYNKFLDSEGYPAIAPPWGTLNAIDLNRGTIAWQIPFGEYPALVARGVRNTGSENYGGGIVTAGGLLLIGATDVDRKFHAFDKLTGKLLWETTLPASGNATPATYEVGGRQFIVIAAGGGKSGAASGGSYVAFALPAKDK